MDLAHMIVARAEELQKEKVSTNFVECKITFCSRNCTKSYSFCVYPGDTRFRFCFGNMKWNYNFCDPQIDILLKNILRQIFRNFMRDQKDIVVNDHYVQFDILYQNAVIFTDEYFIEESITYNDLASYNMSDCNDNTDLFNIQDIFIGFMTMILTADFSLF